MLLTAPFILLFLLFSVLSIVVFESVIVDGDCITLPCLPCSDGSATRWPTFYDCKAPVISPDPLYTNTTLTALVPYITTQDTSMMHARYLDSLS
ncbi:hypothetical protein K435DRAFT_783254, partial [Dendrothele bispora CBS 962.96]